MSEWDTGPEDEEAGAVMKIVGRQLKTDVQAHQVLDLDLVV